MGTNSFVLGIILQDSNSSSRTATFLFGGPNGIRIRDSRVTGEYFNR
ncbi:hypothetical protein [Salmonella phage PSE-D1]|nr:hypothetical protein [Salmonella phage PSE-D1]